MMKVANPPGEGALIVFAVSTSDAGVCNGGAAQHLRSDAQRARVEGGDYARALLERVGAGTSSADDLANLMQFLRSGDLLHGFALVLFEALRHAWVRRT